MAYSKVDSPPFWWHGHGGKVRLGVLSHRLVLDGGAAELYVTPGQKQGEWKMFWCVTHGANDHAVRGTVYFSDMDIRGAFGDVEHVPPSAAELQKRYGAHSAEVGKYIRTGRYLNIPCPGTGHDGDPNMSIFVSDEVLRAVEEYTGLSLS